MRTPFITLFFLLLGINSTAQELVGPDRMLPGVLATFEIVPAQEAAWHIVMPKVDTGAYRIDSNLSKLYFASPIQGEYTLIAGIVGEGRPGFLVKTFVNGDKEVKPTPLPPSGPTSLETWIRTQAPILVKSDHFVTELRLVADCFEQIVRRIDEQNIQTSQNAQAQLRIALVAALALASPTAVTDWMPFFSELGRQLEKELGDRITDLAEVKKTLQAVCDAMKSLEMADLKTLLQGLDNPERRKPAVQGRPFRFLFAK